MLIPPVHAAPAAPRFDPVKDVVITLQRGVLTIQVPAGAHLKRRFLKVELAEGPGALEVGALPPTDGVDDAGDPVWHGTLRIPVTGRGVADPASIRVTYQPCTEGAGGMCYLPQRRLLQARAEDLRP